MTEPSKFNVGLNVDLGAAIGELSKAATKFKENRTYNKDTYTELLDKYSDAMSIIDQLSLELKDAQSSKMPSSDELENMGKMFDMLGTINEKLPELEKLQESMKKFK